MKIMVVAPGPRHSTFDVYNYYLQTLKSENIESVVDAVGFVYHNFITYHHAAITKLHPGMDEATVESIMLSRASRELLLDVIINKPDVLFFVACAGIPVDVYSLLGQIRQELNRKFIMAGYFTESPYMDNMQKIFVPFMDILFVNDKYSLSVFDPENNKHVYYLPHSYYPKVHYPGNGMDIDSKYKSDILFCGTPFYERVQLLSSVDWKDFDFKLVGGWATWGIETGKLDKLQKFTDKTGDLLVNNDILANYYRGAKIALNIHRTRPDVHGAEKPLNNYTDAYSIGPRIYESVACGAFILTDYRKEAEDLFGDTIDFFDGASQLEEKIDYWLSPENEQERINKSMAAFEKIKNCTFLDRYKNYIDPVLRDVLKFRE